ncbi:putative RNA polymerase II subunit B1 CTD phosphatase RPAP2 homolog [Rutidosis leptorrhynchoides]|uniref:putative RNA polymerase II subunit B1 CTD phosphatase RPAP2 homolog n=1 Tax=Rutidosis leptorrhynchoides TaxID=125765 RepID=UPI003A98D2DC
MSNKSSSSSVVAVKDAVHKIQLRLLDGIKSETLLFAAASLISKSDYNDVVTERTIAQMCGYPLCTNPLPSSSPSEPPKKGRYRISLKEHKVYDLLETRMYCCTKCVVDSRAYAESLEDERSLDLNKGKIDKVVRLFEGENGEMGSVENGDFGLGQLSIKENETASVANVSMGEWMGPSNAIEGYVPQHDRKKPGCKLKDSKLKMEEMSFFGEMDFTSTIIMHNDGYSISKTPPVQTKKETNCNKSNDRLTKSSGSSSNAKNVPKSTKTDKSSNAESAVATNHNHVCDEEMEPMHKSSLKSSTSTRTNRSVSWADSKTDGDENRRLCEYSCTKDEKEKTKCLSNMDESIDDADRAFRLASAEACAEALCKAAESVASGESEVTDAVSEAGLVILPPPLDNNEAVSEGAVDAQPTPLKWPKKTGITESHFFDSEDSWFDSPPEEFVLDLSPFATMFMSMFGWVSSSTLAYVYGRDDRFHEDYASVNGREYLRRIVLSDGRSSEIKQTLGGCLSRALPGLVRDLRLPTPISIIENGMRCLLETMSFVDPLPGLRIKQWQVIVLLFIEALSVCRIPAVAPHLINRRSFFEKVFDDGGISREEYEVLKDLILPLGRAPQISTQSGA